MLLPTAFLGVEVLAAAVLEPGVLEASLEGVGLLSVLERVGVLLSAALLAAGFLTSDFGADLGVSGFVDFVAGEGRVRVDSAGFLDAEVAGLVTSFFTGVVFLAVCDAGALPPEGVVEVGLEAAGLAVVVEEVLGVAGLAVAGELLAVGVRAGPVAGRGDAAALGVGLVVLETGGLGEAAELGLVGVADAVLGAGGFLAAAAAAVLVLTPLAAVGAVFLAAVVPVIGFAPLVAGEAPVGFFSPTLLLEAGAGAVPVGFLEGAGVGVLFLTAAGAGFLAAPLVWGLDTPFARRLWVVLGRDPGVLAGLAVPGFVLAVALLVVLALGSPEVLFPVLAAGVSLAWSGWGSAWPVSPTGCCGISSAGLAAWLGSCPTAGAASFTGLDSNVSIGSSAAVATPSGFISPRVVVVRLCKAGLT